MKVVFDIESDVTVRLNLLGLEVPVNTSDNFEDLQQLMATYIRAAARQKLAEGEFEVINVEVLGEPNINVDGDLET